MRTSKLCSGGKGISLRHGKQLLRCLPLVGMLFATSSVNAAGSPGGEVKFNSDVRYSQWAINSRTNDFYANTTSFGLATYGTDGKKLNDRKDTKDKLDYVPGLVAKSMIEAADYYQAFDWSKPWFLSVKEYGDTYCGRVPNTGGSLDDLNAVKLYIGLYNNTNASSTDKTKYKSAIGLAQEGLMAHNKTYFIKTGTLAGDKVVGGWFHKANYNNQMWLDGAYMGSALLAQIVNFNGTGSNVFGSSEADWNMVAKQMNIVWNMCWNSNDKLLYHAFEANAGKAETTKSHAETWAGLSANEPYVFHSQSYWGRANAWYLMALVDVLEAMDKAGQSNTENYTTLKQHLADLAAGIAARQDKTTGGWYQVMDKDGSLSVDSYNSSWNGKPKSATNYIETSATAIFSAAYFKAVRLGLLSSTTQYDYKTIAKNAFEGLVNNFVNTDNGDFHIWGSCRSAGLGGDKDNSKVGGEKFRDGSNAYYLLGYDVPMVKKDENITEGKVLGGFIMAATEYERAYQNQNQDNKQILFAKDLAPTYTINSSADVIDATAYGTDAEKATYQWYKDGKAVANATSATFSPTESGSYYCTATVGNNTIQTSATTVTAATEGGNTPATPTGTTAVYEWGTLTGTTTLNGGVEDGSYKLNGVSNVKALKFVSNYNFKNGKYMTIGSGFKKGDVITLTGYADTPSQVIGVYSAKDGSNITTINLSESSKTYVTRTYTLEADYETLLIGRATSSTTYITALKVERKKADLTATFASNSVTATVGDASVGVPTLTVKAGDKTLAPTTYYTVSYSSDKVGVVRVDDNGTTLVPVAKGDALITATITPKDDTKYNETTATFTVNVKEKVTPEPTDKKNVYDFKSNVGTTTSGNTAIEVTDDNIVFGANYKPREGKYITITPADANVGFKAGDLITITGRSTKGNALMTLNSTLNSETSELYQFNALGTTETTYQYLLQADCPVLYLGRASGSTATITGLTVTRAAATNKTRLVATFSSNSITVVEGAGTIKLPTLTVKAGETVLTEGYTVENQSDNPTVATISGDEITIKGIGTATVFATITPKDKNTYEGCIATYQVTVKEPTPLAISTMDVTMNTVDAEVKQPIIKVYGDNDKLLTLDKDYKLSYSVDNSNVKVDNAGKFSVDGSAYNWTAGTSKVTVTATPTENLGNTYTVGTLTFEYNVVKGKITPVFLEAFKDKTINVKNGSTKTFSVPLIYDGEDVSNYFVYTYTINGTAAASTNVDGNTLTFSKTTGEYKIDVTAKPNTGKEGDDTDDYSEVYNNPVGISFTVKVGKFTRPTVLVDPSSMTMYTGSREEAADVTVMDEKDNIISDDLYKLQWISFTPGVVKVDENGNLEAVSEGTGLVHVVVTGDNLESMSTLLKVFVDDPALYRAKKTDNAGNTVTYGNQRVMWNQDKTMSVSLGGWMFPKDGTGVIKQITTEALSSNNKWDNTASQAKWKLTGFDNVVLSDDSQNARQENGSNAMPESTDLYNATFDYKSTIVDKMFNVPCTGSYLAFNPATNGEVRVHIFQSGAFDSANGKYQYRPQRRVFVMDEAGNFVKSSAEIENANGKPKGGVQDLNKYKWDLNSYKAPSLNEVKKHFPKLPTSFDMTDANFLNNVMESGLDNVPNNVPTNHNGEPGANGWCVLADSPVTYSFRVKAGKTYYLYNFGSKIGFYGYSFEEDATKPKVDEVNYEDDKKNEVTPTEDGHVAKVTINRKFTKGIWTTCVLPFSLNKHQVDAIFGTTYGITKNDDGSTTENTDGTQILYFDRVEGNKAYFVRHAYNTIVAGKPFLIKPAKDVESINTAAVTDYPYVTIENTKPADWCTRNGYAWVSSYNNDMTVQQGDCFISKNDGHFKNFVGDPGTLKGFRGYLKNLSNGAKPQTLSVGMDSNVNEEGTSAIIGLTIDADGNIVTGVADGKVYNVNGQVVSEDSRNFGALPSGVYVINGKKYVK